MLTVYTFGDSVLDCGWYNEYRVNPGTLLVRNNDHLFPEFKGRDLLSRGPAQLDHRALDGATTDDLPGQLEALAATPAQGATVALLTIGGNDMLQEIMFGHDPNVAAFASGLDFFLTMLPIRPVLIGNVYDPTFGDDSRNFLGVDPALARGFHDQFNEVIAQAAARYGNLIDLHGHFLTGDPTWFTHTIEPSLIGASEIRRCFLPYVLACLPT